MNNSNAFQSTSRGRSPEETTQLFFALGAVLIPVIVPELIWWPVAVAPLLLLYALLSVYSPGLRRAPTWLRAGSVDSRTLLLSGIYTLVCCAVLIVWKHVAHPNLSAHLARLPEVSVLLLAATGAGFALLNATIEETAFRGLLQTLVEERWGARAAIIVQAVLFGVGHYGGVPSGLLGCAMGTVYGLGLGVFRQRTQGVGACILSHVIVDSTIYAMLAWNF